MSGTVVTIYMSASTDASMQSCEPAVLVAGRGIEGDRYFSGHGTFSELLRISTQGKPAAELTLIEKEEIDSFNREYGQSMAYGDFRRNIVTQNTRLNDLVGKTFFIGNTELKGIKLCEPCAHLAKTVNPLVLPHMLGRSGLRAQIISNGVVKQGDKLTVV